MLKHLKVSDVKRELLLCGKDQKGKKGNLMAHLCLALQERTLVAVNPADSAEQAKEPSGFPQTAHWKALKHEQTPVEEPVNAFPASTHTPGSQHWRWEHLSMRRAAKLLWAAAPSRGGAEPFLGSCQRARRKSTDWLLHRCLLMPECLPMCSLGEPRWLPCLLS